MKMLPFSVRLIAAAILHQQNHLFIAEIAYLRDQLPKDQSLRFADRWRKRPARWRLEALG